MPSIATLPAPGPFSRVVDVRVFPHGFTTRQGDSDAGPAGSAIVRPNLENDAWHAAAAQKWGGNIVWTGSTPRHTVAYNGPRGRYFGTLNAGGVQAMKTWFSHNGAKVPGPGGRVLSACVKTYASLPTGQTYTGTGDGTLDMQTPSTATGALTGDYEVRCITVGATPRFLITGPDAQPVGVAEAGAFTGAPVLFDGVLRFELQSGAIAFALGDAWTVSVEEADQFVVVVVPAVDGVNRTETVWRRGVSLTPAGPWRQIASIDPVAGQVGGSLQPWFFNASATRAVTCRGLGEDAGGYTLGTVGRTLNVDTLGLTDAPQAAPVVHYVATSTMTASVPNTTPPPDDLASAATYTLATSNPGPHEQLMAQDFDGDTLITVSIEFSATLTGSITLAALTHFGNPEADRSGTASFAVHADLVWSSGQRLEIFDLSGSGAVTDTTVQTFERSFSRAFRHVVLLDIADAGGAGLAYTHYAGSQSAGQPDFPNIDESAAARIEHLVHGQTVSFLDSTSGPHVSDPLSGDGWWAMLHLRPSQDVWTVETNTYNLAAVRGLGDTWRIGHGITMFSGAELSTVAISATTLPTVASGKGFQTSAQDTRGNWLMAAELAAYGTTDLRWPGSITGSGTYTLQTGGPDSLTPATVATLTAYSPDDRWDIGAF